MKKLDKEKDKLKEYASVHQKEIENDLIERVPLKELRSPVHFKHFINHFPVWKDDSTTKCRRVFDASLHAKGKASLNDLMLKGSQLTPHILTTLLRLRLFPFLLCMDISKAFLRMALLPRDRNFTCFLARDNWMDPNSPVSIWRFKSVLFGATSSPFLLNCTVADILKENKFDENLEVFVDNLFSLLIKESEIQSAAANISEIFKHNGMPLHEFASNSAEANQGFNS